MGGGGQLLQVPLALCYSYYYKLLPYRTPLFIPFIFLVQVLDNTQYIMLMVRKVIEKLLTSKKVGDKAM